VKRLEATAKFWRAGPALLALCAPALAPAQQGPGIVDPSRAIDWRQAGVPGGIPTRPACATLSPGATAAEVNAAIAGCPEGQAVFLKAGTYRLSSGIDFKNKSNVTLRGAGPDQTHLVFTGSVNCSGQGGDVCIRNSDVNWPGGPTHSALWTGGYGKGTTQISLSSTAGLKVGSVLVLDQLDDSNTDTGGIWVCQTAGVCVDEGPGGAGRTSRAQMQMVKVVGVGGSTVTISPGLYMSNWRPSQSPGAWWGDTVIQNSGIEDLSLDHAGSDEVSGVFFFNAYNCWMRNVSDLNSNRNHVWLYLTAASTIRDSYFYGTKKAASVSYGVESYMSSDNLVENNIFQRVTAPLMTGGSTEGTVYGYNYAVDDYYAASANWMQGSNYFHAGGTDMVLNEGNDGINVTGDNIHGTHHFVTAFRNHLTGWETGKTAQTVPINLYAFSRYFNVVGNVLGTPGYHDSYQSTPPSFANRDTSIYRLGDPGNLPAAKADALVEATLFRWGNYDTVSGAAKWDAGEVPSALGQFANPLPPDRSLPSSMYLPARPDWWGTMPWPAVGPDVAGGTGPGGRAFKIPAHVCYDATAKDANGVLIFNADHCYRSTATPGGGSSQGTPSGSGCGCGGAEAPGSWAMLLTLLAAASLGRRRAGPGRR
jgi:MYXO-CTERM domain-containing protein